MNTNRISGSNLSARLEIYFRKIIYFISPFTFAFRFERDLNSLKKQINMYFRLFKSYRKQFSSEIDFLNKYAARDKPWSFMFPYLFVFDYDYNKVKVYKDDKNGLLYVIHNGRKLYYSRQYQTESDVKKAYNNILIEQDERSPHRYLFEQFDIREGDTVADVGAAEGNFSLDLVERAGNLYIFENNSSWIEALNATFEPWKNKVHIINKFISDIDNENCATMDDLFGKNRIDFIKIDVEGAEILVLKGSEKILNHNPSLKLLVCTYHRNKDAGLIAKKLNDLNFNCEFSEGYMLYIYDTLKPPYFRKVLIRAEKSFD